MPVNDTLKNALRAAYQDLLWKNVSYAAIILVFLMVLASKSVSPVWVIPACVGVVAAIGDYAWERVMLRKGKNAIIVLVLFLLLPLIHLALLLWDVFPEANAVASVCYLPPFLLIRTLIPLIRLLRDSVLMREGRFCESVGRMKQNTHRMDNPMTREYYVLFQDELTREAHLIRMENMSSAHRYQVLYLPHSGVAVGEIIPRHRRKKFNSDETLSSTASTENNPCDSHFDPNSPERRLAAKYGKADKVCRALATVLGVGGFCCGVLSGFVSVLLGGIISMIVLGVVGGHMKNKSLKLRCTQRITARCFDTIKRGGGRYSTRHPIVEYTVDRVTYTKELPISCSPFDVGERYTVYYDPLDPTAVRAE